MAHVAVLLHPVDRPPDRLRVVGFVRVFAYRDVRAVDGSAGVVAIEPSLRTASRGSERVRLLVFPLYPPGVAPVGTLVLVLSRVVHHVGDDCLDKVPVANLLVVASLDDCLRSVSFGGESSPSVTT